MNIRGVLRFILEDIFLQWLPAWIIVAIIAGVLAFAFSIPDKEPVRADFENLSEKVSNLFEWSDNVLVKPENVEELKEAVILLEEIDADWDTWMERMKSRYRNITNELYKGESLEKENLLQKLAEKEQ